MKKLPKILMIPPTEKWYVEAHCEYLIRYLSDEFFFEIAMPDDGTNNPFHRNPDDYDLLWPLWPGAWHLDHDKYAHKVATVFYCPVEGPHDVAVVGASTPLVEASCEQSNIPYHSLRFGVDTNLFAPYKMEREDDLLHVGYIGNHANVRHMVGTVISSLRDLEGIRLMLFPHSWVNNGGTWTDWDGENMVKYVVGGNKLWTGIPNIYNRMDVLLRMDQDPAYSFPTQEAAACGVPVIATNTGIDHQFADAGAATLIPGDRNYYMNNVDDVAQKVREAVIELRDNPEQRRVMGNYGRSFVENSWQWKHHIDAWRLFFREGVKNARGN